MPSFSSVLLLTVLACRHQPPPPLAQVDAQAVQDLPAPIQVLLASAESPDAGLRRQALALLIAQEPAPGGGAYGPRAVYDPSPYVQRAAADALAARGDAESTALLRTLARLDSADPYARGHAGMLLAQAGDTQALPALRAAMDQEREHWRRLPLALAAAAMGDSEALTAVQKDLARGDLPLELDLFRDLGASGLTELAPALREGTEMLPPDLALPAAAALMQLGDKQGETTLRNALASPDLVDRLSALDVLSELPGEHANELLRKAARSGPEPARVYAACILLERGEGDPTQGLAALELQDRELRAQAAWGLGGYLSQVSSGRMRRRVQQSLRAALSDSEPVVVAAAVDALGRSGDPQDRDYLAPFLTAETESLRLRAAGALLALQSTSATAMLPAHP